MTTLNVTLIDNKPMVALPPELAERLGVSKGGQIVVDEAAMHPSGDVVERQVAIFNDVMQRRREVLRRLAE
jgi:hypothetical protein